MGEISKNSWIKLKANYENIKGIVVHLGTGNLFKLSTISCIFSTFSLISLNKVSSSQSTLFVLNDSCNDTWQGKC